MIKLFTQTKQKQKTVTTKTTNEYSEQRPACIAFFYLGLYMEQCDTTKHPDNFDEWITFARTPLNVKKLVAIATHGENHAE